MTSEKPSFSKPPKVERRAHVRFPLDFPVRVRGTDEKGDFIEKVQLLNASGGGMQFQTACVDRYRNGLRLQVEVELPGPRGPSGWMRGRAEVVWTAAFEQGSIKVGCRIVVPLRLDRGQP
jgi:hypothetical protein